MAKHAAPVTEISEDGTRTLEVSQWINDTDLIKYNLIAHGEIRTLAGTQAAERCLVLLQNMLA